MWKKILLLLYIGYVHSLTDEEVKAEFTKYVLKCMKEHPVDLSEATALQQMIVPTKTETKCLLACAYKLEGTMTEDGLYDVKHGYQVAETTQKGNSKKLENAKKLCEICAEVNNMEVSDGTKGCERAALLFKCTIDNAPKELRGHIPT